MLKKLIGINSVFVYML